MKGIAEAVVKIFKRDCARLSILPDAAIVIALLPAWLRMTTNSSALRLEVPVPKRISSPQCLAQQATCPVKRVHTRSL